MKQPTNFGFDDDARMLKESARKFFQENFKNDKLHTLVASNPDPLREPEALWDKDLWKQLVDLGWTTLAVPESVGGMGISVVAVSALVEEVGRAAFPSPLIATLNAVYVLSACETDAAAQQLKLIAQGQTATLAITNKSGSLDNNDADVTEEGEVLNGTAYYVQDAQKADLLVVKSKSKEGISLYVVSRDAEGVTIFPDSIFDLTRDQAHIEFNNVKDLVEVARPETAIGALDKAEPAILTIQAADMCGAAEWQLQTTAEYARTRQQFDHPIGFFQAVKHPLVDTMLAIDQARSLTYNAACAIDHEPENAEKFARMANASACEAAGMAAKNSVQLHGGIGFTWECYVQLYFKRQKHNQVLFGNAVHQRAKLADLVL
jgi:alkylation response protein AidB-like acyl-CoA dehydrogenase